MTSESWRQGRVEKRSESIELTLSFSIPKAPYLMKMETSIGLVLHRPSIILIGIKLEHEREDSSTETISLEEAQA